MKYIITENQYSLITEDEEYILDISPEAFEYRWDIIVKILEKRGFPKWRSDKSLYLSDLSITSLHNLVEVKGSLDIFETSITDLGSLRKVDRLTFDPDILESIGDLTEVKKFDDFEQYAKAIKLGLSGGTLGGESNVIGFSQFRDLVDLPYRSDIDYKFLRKFFKGEMADEYYHSYNQKDIINSVVEYYLNRKNIEILERIIESDGNYDDELTITENIINSESDIYNIILDSYTICDQESYNQYIINLIESALNEIVDVKSHWYDEKGHLYFDVYFNYDYIIESLNMNRMNNEWNGNMYDTVINMFSNDFVYNKPILRFDDRFESSPSKECVNEKFEELIN